MTRSGLKRGAATATAEAPEESAAAAAAAGGKRAKTTDDPAASSSSSEVEPPTSVEAAAAAASLPPAGGQPKVDEDAAAAAAAQQGHGDAAAVVAEAAAAVAVKEDPDMMEVPPAAAKGGKAKSGGGSLRSQAYQQQQQFNTEQMLANFDHYLFQLLAFKVEAGNFHVPKDHELHTWLQFLKREFKGHCASAKSSLSDEQIKVLEFLHVPLTSRGEEHWNRFYELLKQYHQMHGHVLVPRLCEIPGLGDWVTDQRRQYKAWKQGQQSQLTHERREKLEQLGFAWQVRNRPEWDMRFQQLLEYRDKHGDCKVPQHYKDNKALGKWTAKQREQYKLYKKGQHSFLTPYRLEKLNQIGFVWQVRSSAEEDDDDVNVDTKEGLLGGVKGALGEEQEIPAMKAPPPEAGKGGGEDLVAEAAAMAAAGVVDVKQEDVLITANV